MAVTLSNVETEDTYVDSLTLTNLQAVYVVVQVYNAAVFLQRMAPVAGLPGMTGWQDEVLYPPGVYQMRRNLIGVRVRSAIAGLPALVSIEALSPGE